MRVNLPKLTILLIKLLLLTTLLQAQASTAIDLLPKSKILYSDDIFEINSTTSRSNFRPYNKKSAALIDPNKNLWVELNANVKGVEEPLIFTPSPLLTKFKIYDSNGTIINRLGYKYRKGMTLEPYFTLPQDGSKKYYLELQSRYLPLAVNIKMQSEEDFFKESKRALLLNTLSLGVVLTLILFLLIYFYYTRKQEILYLLFLLATVVYFQFTAVGLAQIFTPHFYSLLDISLTSVKLNLITIALFLYSSTLLALNHKSKGYMILKLLAAIAGIEIFVAGFLNLKLLYALIPLYTALALSAYLTLKALSRAKIELLFTLLGFSLLFIIFLAYIAAPYGIIFSSSIYKYTLILSTLGLFLLTFAYIYRFIYKQQSESNTLMLGLDKKYMLESMVKKTKEELETLNKTKEMLTSNIETIVNKNFGQILNSLEEESGETMDIERLKRKLYTTKQHMQAISICYNQILESKNLNSIDMDSVIEKIIEEIASVYSQDKCTIKIARDITATLPLNDAIVAATAISEYLLDGFRYACEQEVPFTASITLKNSDTSYILNIKDLPKEVYTNRPTPLQKLKEKLQELRGLGKAKVNIQ